MATRQRHAWREAAHRKPRRWAAGQPRKLDGAESGGRMDIRPDEEPDLKQHHCLVPFDQLPREQQAKDFLFRGVVHALV